MNRCLCLLIVVLLLAALPACAVHPQRPPAAPHHFSVDADGNRLACYSTAIAREYECYPVEDRLAHDHHHHEPWWPLLSVGLIYAGHHHSHHVRHRWHHHRSHRHH